MITCIPKRPNVLIPSIEKPNAMHQKAFDKAYKEYVKSFNHSFIKHNDTYWNAHEYALKDALIALSVYLSHACEGMLYGEV